MVSAHTGIVTSAAHPFRLSVREDRSPWNRMKAGMGAAMLERMLRFPQLGRIYDRATGTEGLVAFLDRVLAELGAAPELSEEAWERLPRTGPAVVVANHPFGAIEGLLLARVLLKLRPDVRVLANHLLARIPELRELFIFVDPFGRPESPRANVAGVRQAIAWVKAGGVLVVFPAGTVSHLRLEHRCVTDPPWHAGVARIIRRAGAPVTPVFISGRNSNAFQLAGLINPQLRTLLLPRELLRRRRATVAMRVGHSIPLPRLERLPDDEDLMLYLRLRTYALEPEAACPSDGPRQRLRALFRRSRVAEVAPPQAPDQLAREIAGLPPGARLDAIGDLEVYLATAAQAPTVLREIGRLREITFRAVREGSGAAADLDRFDATYLHLFVHDRREQRIVGGYRLGLTDVLTARDGLAGLYTRSLFQFDQRLLDRLGPCVELGRSFVRPEYQKSYAPLLLLWRGVGAFLVAHPRYRHLLGAVSINNRYQRVSQWMMKAFLEGEGRLSPWAGLVQSKRPPALRPPRAWNPADTSRVLRDLDDVADVLADVEAQPKGVPVLVRQYLKMGARLLAFNVDPDFGYTLDGLMVVDMSQADPRQLVRYLGKEGMAAYLAHHRSESRAGAARQAGVPALTS